MPFLPALGIALGGAIGSFSFSSIFVNLATSFVLSGLQKLIAPKPKSSGGGGGGSSLSSGTTTQVKQPLVTRKTVYGEQRVSGGILFISSSNGNTYLNYILELGGNEIEEIGEILINDFSLAPDHFDANGLVNTGRYSGLVTIKKHLGAAGQAADAALIAELPSLWTTNHTLNGIPYLYIKLKWDQDKFPNGFPSISAYIKGKKLCDPRTGGYAYSNNIALMAYDYMANAEYGIGANTSEIDEDYIISAANICDEMVTTTDLSSIATSTSAAGDTMTLTGSRLIFQTGDRVTLTTTGTLPAGLSLATNYFIICYQRKDTVRIKFASSLALSLAGTAIDLTDAGTGVHTVIKNAEPRYSGAARLDSGEEIGENLKDILTGMMGEIVYSGGKLTTYAGAYQTPTVYFEENDLVSAINIQTKISRRERFNQVQGTYLSPINEDQPSNYPAIKNATYVTQDNEEKIVRPINFPVTQRPYTAQRLAKIALEQSRQEITFSCDFNLTGMLVQAGDNIYFSNTRMGWVNKVFKVVSWRLSWRNDGDVATPIVSMTLRETAAAVFDWAGGEETSIDLAPNTTLPNARDVSAVSGMRIDSEAVETAAADSVYKILIRWDAIEDAFVNSGGFVEIEFKPSASSEWRPTATVAGASVFAEVTLAAQLNAEYDIRIRAVNNIGVRSSYNTLTGFLVGSSGGVGTTNDWGNWTETLGTMNDWGNWTETLGTMNDWGFFT